ncbi:hypothetical protein ACU18_01060 [Arthrobacter sp. ZBG10]|uniref:hypothetical protein n=1 Tax=unclassified Arthrobacter TaxID=235627 RepID=UPI0006819402|nr:MULTISPECIES: hypothetical protein [unclassified Arthrobacter]KNH22486.1 hypothetical protein ACU18_01060 [Arthrobacter sp. ZBG10]KQQ92253.1 hypothetical protein ASF72_03415 [Arthrobacter sp. Leaf141]
MIPYRPIAPLTAGPRKGWTSVLAAVVLAALLGTTAPAALAADTGTASSVAAAAAATPLVATEPVRRES